jgi:hypothetical protein
LVKYPNTRFQLTELAFALEEVVVRPYQLTGYLDIDARNVPINRTRSTAFLDYHPVDMKQATEHLLAKFAFCKAISNPADFLYNILAKSPNSCVNSKK